MANALYTASLLVCLQLKDSSLMTRINNIRLTVAITDRCAN